MPGGFGRIVQAQAQAEFTLLAIGVLLKHCSAQVTAGVDIRRLDLFAHAITDRPRQLMMKKSSSRLVVHSIPARALAVAEKKFSRPHQLTVITAKRRNV